MGSICSCGTKQRCRIVILGISPNLKQHIYYTLTKEKITNKKFSQKKVRLYGMNVYLCNVGEDEASRSLWFCNARHADGIIFVIDHDDNETFEEAMDEFRNLMDEKINENINVLVLVNKTRSTDNGENEIHDDVDENKINNDESKIVDVNLNNATVINSKVDYFDEYLNYSNVNIFNCDIMNWKDVDSGLKWLCDRISES
ncbi:ADP-ribosylation factor-like protein 4D [Dictyocoela muelleri]|nr:ADP-ribosylation factor-like protein 4D [Dictyocoela muelleri]